MLGWLGTVSLAHSTPDFATALAQSMSMSVAMQPDLGEGEGAFRSQSRYSVDSVNCITWFQWVLAAAYTQDTPNKFDQHLDSIRYYNQTVGFDTRKHFVDRWLLYDPAPLQAITLDNCQTNAARSVVLELSLFRAQQGYSCSLYQENSPKEQLVIPYMTVRQTELCQRSLQDGYYALFMVPNERWLTRWSQIGEMGTVHAMILHMHQGSGLVYQASIDQKSVVSESWSDLKERLSVVSDGYRIYEFDPTWSPNSTTRFSAEVCR